MRWKTSHKEPRRAVKAWESKKRQLLKSEMSVTQNGRDVITSSGAEISGFQNSARPAFQLEPKTLFSSEFRDPPNNSFFLSCSIIKKCVRATHFSCEDLKALFSRQKKNKNQWRNSYSSVFHIDLLHFQCVSLLDAPLITWLTRLFCRTAALLLYWQSVRLL